MWVIPPLAIHPVATATVLRKDVPALLKGRQILRVIQFDQGDNIGEVA